MSRRAGAQFAEDSEVTAGLVGCSGMYSEWVGVGSWASGGTN